MSAVVYPISGCWIWNANGWLAQLGFHDFAGGTAVHLLGGSAAFAGAAVLGARIGKYDKRKVKGYTGTEYTFGGSWSVYTVGKLVWL